MTQSTAAQHGKPKAAKSKKRRRPSGSGALLYATALAAVVLFLTGGVRVHRGTGAAQEVIAGNVAVLAELERQAPADLDAEARQKRLALLAEKNGILVDDLAAEQQRILSLASWTKAQLRAWFSDAALVGDSLTLGARSYGGWMLPCTRKKAPAYPPPTGC